MKMKRVFICFVGMDGVGKTTNAKQLGNWMRRRGMEVEYIWNRFDPLLLKAVFIVARVLFLRGRSISRDFSRYSQRKRKLLANPAVAFFYEGLMLFEAIVQTYIRVGIRTFSEKNIICDRYIYDVIVTLAKDLDYSESKVSMVVALLSRIVPKPDVSLLIDAPEEIAYSHKGDIPSLDFLGGRRRIYLQIGRECGMTILDGSKPLNEIFQKVQEIVQRSLSTRSTGQ